MDVTKAIEFGQLVGETYKIAPSDLTNSAGKVVHAGGTDYVIVSTIYVNDLATDMNPARGQQEVSIGFVCQASRTDDTVVAIRGTEGILEWIHDAEFGLVPCPFLTGGGHTEDGFTDMYSSLRTGPAPDSPTLAGALAQLPFPRPPSSLTVCGHSLGGALATLLGLDVAANTVFRTPAVYTFASPRTGDSLFASTYNQVVTNSNRIANRLDIVTTLPPSPPYQHVASPYALNPVRLVPLPPQVLVEFTPYCEHSLTTYLYLLSRDAGGSVIPLESSCQP